MAITATVKGGGADVYGAVLTLQRGVSSLAKVNSRLFDQRELRKDRRLMVTLLGAAAGSTATETIKRVQHVTGGEYGGKRTIETINLVNRATTSGDTTDLTNRYLTYRSRPTTYPTDKATRW